MEMQKRLATVMVLFFLLGFLTLPFGTSVGEAPPTGLKQISISISLTSATYDSFISWIKPFEDFANFTFVLTNYSEFNSTQLNGLSKLGDIIPLFGYTQCYNTEVRSAMLDEAKLFFNSNGQEFKGIFQFQIDTYLLNYAKNSGLDYVVGYAYDQWLIDWVTTRGGLPLPYYASQTNSLVPSSNAGMLVLPAFTFDYIDSFELGHSWCSHPLDNLASNSTDYIIKLQEAAFENSTPFAYFAFHFEYNWLLAQNKLENAYSLLDHFVNHVQCQKYSLDSFAKLYQQTFTETPTYQLTFQSPNSHKILEFYGNRDYRIQRLDGKIVSYIKYQNQQTDPYLTSNATINWQNPSSTTNCIFQSLNFTINALGGAPNRAPTTKEQAVPYNDSLDQFPSVYQNKNSNTQTQQLTIITAIITTAITTATIGTLWKIKTKNKHNR